MFFFVHVDGKVLKARIWQRRIWRESKLLGMPRWQREFLILILALLSVLLRFVIKYEDRENWQKADYFIIVTTVTSLIDNQLLSRGVDLHRYWGRS